MKVKSKFLIVEDGELSRALEIGEPPRCFQNLDVYPYLNSPRVFVEVTDRVKFKLNRSGVGRFVFAELSVVHPKRKKVDETVGIGSGTRPALRAVGAAVSRQHTRRSGAASKGSRG